MEFIPYKNTKIAYQVSGEGQPLVLLHGFCEDSSIWDDFIPGIDARIIRIDLPGFGLSGLPEHLSIEMMADIVATLLDLLKVKTCILVGHSLGGYVGLAFAKKEEHRLSGLGLFHSHPFADSEEKIKARNRSIHFIERNGPIHYVKQLIPQLFLHGSQKRHTFEVEKLIHKAINYTPAGIIASLKAMAERPDQVIVLEKIKCPVLMIIGMGDRLIPIDLNLQQITIPQITSIHLLNSVGHMGILESPSKTRKVVNDFINFCQVYI